jgi:hypothetical protein
MSARTGAGISAASCTIGAFRAARRITPTPLRRKIATRSIAQYTEEIALQIADVVHPLIDILLWVWPDAASRR